RCCCRARAKKEERERDRVADAERAEEHEERACPDEPAGGDERPCLRRPPQRGRARAQPAAEPEAQGAPASDQAWQGDDQRRCRDSATATTTRPAHTPFPAPPTTAAARASGAKAALSIGPSMTRERQSARTPQGQGG